VNKNEAGHVLRRYTDVLAVLDTLRNRRITLLSTMRWVDRNDRAALELYGDRVGYNAVVAYCMTEASETFHHWQVFAGHGFGACIVFNKVPFIEHITRLGLLHGKVKYKISSQLGAGGAISSDRIPFLKREVFADEKEYRIISGLRGLLDTESLSVQIELPIIKRIVLGPSIPRPLADTLEQIIRSFEGCECMQINYSHLHENQIWSRSLARHVGRGDRS